VTVSQWAPDWTPLLDAVPEWADPDLGFAALLDARFAPHGHGDLPRWHAALGALPELPVHDVDFGDTVTITGPITPAARAQLQALLLELHPWRKGPFSLFGIDIETEWRSDWKWRRVAPHVGPLTGERILDVGCGNGYFGWRMLAAGAAGVVGIDPTLLFCMQHRAIDRYVSAWQEQRQARDRSAGARNWVLPLRFEELPAARFDRVFSMGVVYHRRDPLEHVNRLCAYLRPGGTLVLESLVVTDGPDLVAPDRYARMRNVWTVPAVATLGRWLAAAGLTDVRVVDVTPTTTAEQRSTSWMRFESLADALDPGDPNRTVEGHPAPVRAVVLGRKPV
jgi:tRNA (mo5U34)-methyltransferase